MWLTRPASQPDIILARLPSLKMQATHARLVLHICALQFTTTSATLGDCAGTV
jgi:hypothetical protein